MQLIHCRHFPVDHYVLVDDENSMLPEKLVTEARRRAEGLAAASTGHPQNFTLIHNGSGIARRARPHVHIICTRTRAGKALIYLYIGMKNLLTPVARAG